SSAIAVTSSLPSRTQDITMESRCQFTGLVAVPPQTALSHRGLWQVTIAWEQLKRRGRTPVELAMRNGPSLIRTPTQFVKPSVPDRSPDILYFRQTPLSPSPTRRAAGRKAKSPTRIRA